AHRRIPLRRLALAVLVFLLASSYWILPVATQIKATEAAGTYGGVQTALQGNSANLSLENVTRLIGTSPITETYRGERDFPWAHLYNDSTGHGFPLLPLLPLGFLLFQLIKRRLYRLPSVLVMMFAFIG